MSLDRILDPLAPRLAAALDGVRVDDVTPVVLADLPCAVLSLTDVEQALVGLGRIPRGTRTGALHLTAAVDLADPVLDLRNGETLRMLSPDRRTLTLPHGPIVRADGTSDLPFTAEDVSADDGAPFTVVAGDPTGRQVRPDPAPGTLLFGDPLAPTGRLTLGYHVGQWDTETTRVQGVLLLDVVAATPAAVATAARAAAAELDVPAQGVRTRPLAWEPVVPALPDDAGVPRARSQRLTFHLDAEVELPVLTTGGGLISRLAVAGSPSEPFDVTRGAPT